MYEPPQTSGSAGKGSSYDSSAFTEAAAAAVAAAQQDGGGGVETCQAKSTAAAGEVARAVRVAELLGLRLVGWCLSHDKVRQQEEEVVHGRHHKECFSFVGCLCFCEGGISRGLWKSTMILFC